LPNFRISQKVGFFLGWLGFKEELWVVLNRGMVDGNGGIRAGSFGKIGIEDWR